MKFVLATCRTKPALTPGDGRLAAALRDLGAIVVAAPWDTIEPAGDEDVVCLRSTWDYHLRWDEFRNWVAQFENQIVSTPMSQGGDSGSLLVDADSRRAVGLLFAGSSQATVFNPIQTVLDALGVTI